MQQEVRRSGEIQNTSLLNSSPSCQRSSSAAPGSCARNHVSRGLGPLVSRGHATGGQEIRRNSKHIPPEFLALLSTLFERGARELCKESRFQGTGAASVSRACNRRSGDQEKFKTHPS